jgi:predicted SnoaL-like aldol condensation-catalyzing enzyme
MTKKKIANDFLRLASKGEAQKAFQLYVGKNFKHHNAYFKGDGETLMKAMDANAVKNPNKVFEIHKILEDGDLVATYSRVQLAQGDMTIAVMHIFRFDNNKIVELWDIGQAAPADAINENGMF